MTSSNLGYRFVSYIFKRHVYIFLIMQLARASGVQPSAVRTEHVGMTKLRAYRRILLREALQRTITGVLSWYRPHPGGSGLCVGSSSSRNQHRMRLTTCIAVLLLLSCPSWAQSSDEQDGLITFSSNRSGGLRIYVMDGDGSNVRLLEDGPPGRDTTHLYGAAGPRWSRDGEQIAFYTYWGDAPERTDGQNIVVINADGTGRRVLTRSGYQSEPTWSPDGREVVYRSLRERNWGLYIFNLETGQERLLVDTPHMDRSPDWSPDGQQIVFSSGYGSDKTTGEDLYIVNADGTGLRQLTADVGEESLGRWSWDGERIVFNASAGEGADLFTIRSDGTDRQRITNTAADYFASFASDGGAFAFTSIQDGNSEVYTVDADGTNRRRLTDAPGRDNAPDWFVPSSGKIAFRSRRDGNDEIYVMNRDGSKPINLTEHPAEDRRPWWSPDGQQIYFESNRNGTWDIFVMDADGSNVEAVAALEAQDKYPALSYDGAMLAMMSSRNESWGLYTMRVDGAEVKQHTRFADFGEGIYDHYPSFSPDGEFLYFASNRGTRIPATRDGGKGLELYRMPLAGGPAERLTFNEEEDSLPMLSPDGATVLFNSSRTGIYHLYTMRTDGREVTPLTWGEASNWSPRWSSDGAYITFVSTRDGGSELYRMRADGTGIRRLTFNEAADGGPILFIGR